jgi:hypothetical protein
MFMDFSMTDGSQLKKHRFLLIWDLFLLLLSERAGRREFRPAMIVASPPHMHKL